MWMIVVLPAPLGPSSAKTPPVAMSRSIPSSTTRSPKRLVSASVSMAEIMVAPLSLGWIGSVDRDVAVAGADVQLERLVVLGRTGAGREVGAHDAVLAHRVQPDRGATTDADLDAAVRALDPRGTPDQLADPHHPVRRPHLHVAAHAAELHRSAGRGDVGRGAHGVDEHRGVRPGEPQAHRRCGRRRAEPDFNRSSASPVTRPTRTSPCPTDRSSRVARSTVTSPYETFSRPASRVPGGVHGPVLHVDGRRRGRRAPRPGHRPSRPDRRGSAGTDR